MTTIAELICCLNKAEKRLADLELYSPGVFTVDTLPATAPVGARAVVTDADDPTSGADPNGGGSEVAYVIYTGVAWVYA